MDMEFDELKTTLSQLINNTSAAWEHVAKVEWQIRVLKERWKEILISIKAAPKHSHHTLAPICDNVVKCFPSQTWSILKAETKGMN